MAQHVPWSGLVPIAELLNMLHACMLCSAGVQHTPIIMPRFPLPYQLAMTATTLGHPVACMKPATDTEDMSLDV